MRQILTKRFTFLFLVTLYILGSSNNVWTKDDISIIPQPQKIIFKNHYVKITNDWHIEIDKRDNENLFSATYLNQKLSDDFDIILPVERAVFSATAKHIFIGTVKGDLIKEILKKEKMDVSELADYEEGYILEVFDDHIVIAASEPPGVFYGIQTLLQLVKIKEGQILVPAVKITDYPRIRRRGIHILGVNPDKIKNQIDQMAKFKMNTAIIQSGRYFNLKEGTTQQIFREIFSYARQRFIEPIPELTSFGVGADVLNKDLYAAEGIWEENEHFKFVNDIAIPIKPTKHTLVNVIRSEDSNIVIKKLDETRTYKEGVDYKVIDGAISYPYSLNNQPTKIVRISAGAIEDGQEVLISYDYVENRCASWSPWSIPYCPSTERTYKIMFETLENVIRSLRPRYISIGHDEIRGLNRDSRCKKRNLTNAELLADEINRLNDFAKTIDPNIRLLMWDDMINPWHNGGDENYQLQFGGIPGRSSDAIDLIPKDMIIMIWWYDAKDSLNKMRNSPDFFGSKGFDYLVAGYKDKKNIRNWKELTKGRKKCLGIITTTWDGWERNKEGITYTAEIGWR